VNHGYDHVIHQLADGCWVHAFQTEEGDWVGGTDEALCAYPTLEELVRRRHLRTFATREEAEEFVEGFMA
jgi:hypothetical protein